MARRQGRTTRQPQFRLIEAPSRASAARNSSSSTAESVSATSATDLGSGGSGVLGRSAARQWRLPQRQPADRAPAEEAIDPLQQCVGGVLDFQRRGTFHPQHQRGRFLRLALDRPRPLDLQRLGVSGDLGSCDLRPSRHQFARGKSLLGIGVGKHVAEQDGKRFCRDRAGFCHGALISPAARRKHAYAARGLIALRSRSISRRRCIRS